MNFSIDSHGADVALHFTQSLDATRESDGTWLELGEELRRALRNANETLYVDVRELDHATTRGLHDLQSLLGLVQGDAPIVYVGPGPGLSRLAELGTGDPVPACIATPPWERLDTVSEPTGRSSPPEPSADTIREQAIYSEVEELLSEVFQYDTVPADTVPASPEHAPDYEDALEGFSTTAPSVSRADSVEEFVIDLDLERLYLEHQSDSRERCGRETEQTLIFGKHWRPVAPSDSVPNPSAASGQRDLPFREARCRTASGADEAALSSSAPPRGSRSRLAELREVWDGLQREFELNETRAVQLVMLARSLSELRNDVADSIGTILDDERQGPRGDRWAATLLALSTLANESTAEPLVTSSMRTTVLASCAEHRHWEPRLGWCHDGLEEETRQLAALFADGPTSDMSTEFRAVMNLWRAAVAVTAGRSLTATAWRMALGDAQRYLDSQTDAHSALARIVDAHGYYLPGTWVELSTGEAGIVSRRTTARTEIEVWVIFQNGRAISPRRFPDASDIGVSVVGVIAPPRMAT